MRKSFAAHYDKVVLKYILQYNTFPPMIEIASKIQWIHKYTNEIFD